MNLNYKEVDFGWTSETFINVRNCSIMEQTDSGGGGPPLAEVI